MNISQRYKEIRHEYILKKLLIDGAVKIHLSAKRDDLATKLAKELGEKYKLPKLRKNAITYRKLAQIELSQHIVPPEFETVFKQNFTKILA